MALRKIVEIEGEAYINTSSGQISLGHQKTAFTAYCKVININTDKINGRVTVECKDEKHKVIEHHQMLFSVENDAQNFIKQAYLQLKTLPKWADATDC